jgi:alkylhydroperoxidase family enzyme
MPRVSEIESDGGHPALSRVFAEDRERYGAPLNTTKVLAHRPEVLEAARGLSSALERSGLLPPALRALVNLRVALLNGCPF